MTSPHSPNGESSSSPSSGENPVPNWRQLLAAVVVAVVPPLATKAISWLVRRLTGKGG